MGTVKYQVVECEKCKKSFKLKPKIIKTEMVTEEVERTYFHCPKCKHKFISFYKDEEFKHNVLELEELQGKVRVKDFATDSEEFKEILAYYKKLLNRNLEISKLYKNIYGA